LGHDVRSTRQEIESRANGLRADAKDAAEQVFQLI
jgi:hypothetical protein